VIGWILFRTNRIDEMKRARGKRTFQNDVDLIFIDSESDEEEVNGCKQYWLDYHVTKKEWSRLKPQLKYLRVSRATKINKMPLVGQFTDIDEEWHHMNCTTDLINNMKYIYRGIRTRLKNNKDSDKVEE